MKIRRSALACFCLGIFALLNGCGGSSGSSGSGGSGSGSGGGSETPTPTVTAINPTSVSAGSAATTLTVTGTGFIASTTIQVGGTAEVTTYVSSTQVSAVVPASQLASGAQLAVVAVNGALSSGNGSSLQVTNPSPAITSLSPSTAIAGTTSPIVTVAGTGFVPTTTVQVNGSVRTTTYVNATQVNVALTSADVATGGTLSLTAVNSTPGGGTSTAATFTVNNLTPSVSSTTPTSVLAGSTTTITVNGSYFVPASTVKVNGTAVTTTYLSSTQLTFSAASLTGPQVASISVTNPAPGGGTSTSKNFAVLGQTPTPTITQISPAQFYAGSGATTVTVTGTDFWEQVVPGTYYLIGSVLWNGTPLTISYGVATSIPQNVTVQIPANLIASVGTATVTFSSTTATPATSNSVTVNIVPPPAPTLTSISPAAGAVNTSVDVQVYGTGFASGSTVALNGNTIPSTFTSSTQMKVTLPASALSLPGNYNLTVTTPAPGGGTTAALPFTAYLALANNDMVYSPKDGLIYASVPAGAVSSGNSVLGIDPLTGATVRQIYVGSNPNKLAISTDGTQLFAGLDGAAAYARVDLGSGQLAGVFSLGAGSSYYSTPNTAQYMAAVPGLPNSVAIVTSGSGVVIYDDGIPRPKTSYSYSYGNGPITFGSSSSQLFQATSGIAAFTVDGTGITAASIMPGTSSSVYNISGLQYDNGNLYLTNGAIINASTGALQGTLYATTSVPVNGPIVSDSSLGLAFVGESIYQTPPGTAVMAFNESTLNPTGTIPFNGSSYNSSITLKKIVRWGQNGVALNTSTQLFIFRSSVVKDLSSSPADLSASITAPQTATTGAGFNYVVSLKNQGPNAAQNVAASLVLDSSLIISSITTSQGSCSTGYAPTCNLGTIANGSTATVTVSATPTTAATIAVNAAVTSVSYDPTSTNNQASSSTTVTGSFFAMSPVVTTISPELVQAGSDSFTLTVNGSGFNSSSTINIDGSAQTTAYVGPTKLTASIDSSLIKNFGWVPVTVSNPSPGGGTSQPVPLNIYATISVPANAIAFDPFAQKIYASVPSAATSITGNSIVGIDPASTTVGTSVVIGSEPNVMAETSDGQFMYVSLTGSNSLAQFDLLQQKLVATIPVTRTQSGVPTGFSATGLAVMPGANSTLAVDINDSWGSFGIFDISGNTGTFRPNFSGSYQGQHPLFPDATHLYAVDGRTGYLFYRYSINSNGLSLSDSSNELNIATYSSGNTNPLYFAGGLAYGAAGGVINPLLNPPLQIATLPVFDLSGNGYGANFVLTPLPDSSLQKDFGVISNGSNAYLTRYDGNRFLPEKWFALPTPSNNNTTFLNMLRWGRDGLAFLVSTSNYSTNQTTRSIMLLRGPFVAPQELLTLPAATLTSSSVTSVNHGSGNVLITLTGTNFLAGMAVTWNGSYRTTTIVDTSHATVAIPASDLVSAGSGALAATNFGAAASNTLTVTIN